MPEIEIPVSATLRGPKLRSAAGEHLPSELLIPKLEAFVAELQAIAKALKEKSADDVYEVTLTLDFYNDRASRIFLTAGNPEDPDDNRIIYTMRCYCNGP